MAYGKWRAGAQFFGQDLGYYGNDEMRLDWANLDYQACQWFGLRAGRVKTPRGLYNEALDLDSTRPYVLLPQSVYDARLRDFNSSFDGAMAYGNVGLHKIGSLDYRLYGGHIGLSTSSGASDYYNQDIPLNNAYFTMDSTFGGSLFWNLPVDGLRLGYSYQAFQNFASGRKTGGGSVADRRTDLYSRNLLSLEYTYGKWIFALEGGADLADYTIKLPTGGNTSGTLKQRFDSEYAYVSVSRQITHRLQLGVYYSYRGQHIVGIAGFNLTQGDLAISARYDFTDYLLAKIEAHYMDGSGMLFNTADHPQPVGSRDNSWLMLDAKITFSF